MVVDFPLNEQLNETIDLTTDDKVCIKLSRLYLLLMNVLNRTKVHRPSFRKGVSQTVRFKPSRSRKRWSKCAWTNPYSSFKSQQSPPLWITNKIASRFVRYEETSPTLRLSHYEPLHFLNFLYIFFVIFSIYLYFFFM